MPAQIRTKPIPRTGNWGPDQAKFPIDGEIVMSRSYRVPRHGVGMIKT
jgi:hypothetical protein